MTRLSIGLAMSLVLACIVTTQAVSSQNKQSQKSVAHEEPTVVQQGVITKKQKAHSKLFPNNRRSLLELASRQSGDIDIVEEEGHVIDLPKTGTEPPILQSAVCKADAVVVGVLKSKSSQFTEGEDFVFTDYEMQVEEIIKNNSSAPIQLNKPITVTREGGEVKLNGRTFHAESEGFKPTKVGERYLFFLRFIPETGAYRAYGNGSFQLDANSITALGRGTRKELLGDNSKDSPTFLNEVRASATNSCNKN